MPRMPTASSPFHAANPQDMLRKAMALHSQGKLTGAADLYRQLLAVVPNHFDATHLLGVVHAQTDDRQRARELFDKALAIQPGHPEVHFNRGTLLQAERAFDDAIADFTSTLRGATDHQGALNNRMVCLEAAGRLDDALADSDRLLALDPDNAVYWNNRGKLLTAMMRYDEALPCLDKAIKSRPDYIEALSNRGNLLAEFHRFDEAMANYDRVIATRPDFADAHFAKSQILLRQGNYDEGWRSFEWRWQQEGALASKRNFDAPLWLGEEDIAGKTILVHAEQGLGDTVQFCRYLPGIAALGARVIVEAPPLLHELLSSLGGIEALVGPRDDTPSVDFHCPMMSLPLAFGTTLETMPTPQPYLSAAPDLVRSWSARLGAGAKPRVAIAWRGNPVNTHDHKRSMQLADLLPHLSPEIDWLSLHHQLTASEQELAARSSNLLTPLDDTTDMTDAAAICALSDAVLTIDTSMAHIAGALGRPTTVILSYLPDYRWLLDRDDTPWYDSVTLLRQGADRDWTPVIKDAVANVLRCVTPGN